MLGILVEKASAGRNFAKALGGVQGTFDNTPFVIVPARGHLYEYRPPEFQVPKDQAPLYKSWDLANLPWDETVFSWKRSKKEGIDSLLANIKSALGNCDEIVIATDVDPSGEGQLLAWEILDELGLKSKKITRMYFDDESVKEVQKAFRNRKPLPKMQDDPEFKKALFRSQWDFLSMQFTRIATKCGDGGSILRQGRLKSAMVQIVGDGLEAVANYKKIPYYQNRFRDENGILYTNPDEPQFPTPDAVPQSYHASAVEIDSKTKKTTAPPRYMDLAALSSRLSSKGFKAKAVLDVYQKMYENQIVSYPRNEDKRITPEQFNELLPLVDRIAAVVGVDVSLLTHRTARKTHVGTKNPNGKAVSHGANRPGPNVPARLSDLDVYGDCAQDIYQILALNYLATLAEDYEYESQKGHVKDFPAFVGTTSVPLFAGWRAVFNDDSSSDQDEDSKALGTQAEPFVFEGFPPKPPVPTMTWLNAQLEKYDVGTGATRTSTYAEVTNERSKYPLLKDSRGKITMTEFGDMSYRLLRNTHIGDLKLTEQVYAEMDGVAAGTMNAAECLAKIRGYVQDDMTVMQNNGVDMRKALGKTLQTANAKEKYEGRWKGKLVKFTRTWAGHRFTDDECRALCAGEEIEVRGLVSAKTGKEYGVLGKLTKQSYNGHEYVGFERTGFLQDNASFSDGGQSGEFKRPEGVPKTWCGHRFTDDERTLLESGQPLLVTDAVSKKTGKKFSCTLTYEKRDDGEMGIVPRFS